MIWSLLLLVDLVFSKSFHECPAHFGHQLLSKSLRGAVGRKLVMKCAVLNWNQDDCGERHATVRWFRNSSLLQPNQHFGVEVGRTRLRIAVMSPDFDGHYSCVLPNGLRRRFNVTSSSRGANLTKSMRRDLVPQLIVNERENHVYWLPAILDASRMFVFHRDDRPGSGNLRCLFYVLPSKLSDEMPKVVWTFRQMVVKKLVTLNPLDMNPHSQEDPPRPQISIRTQPISCRIHLVDSGWRKVRPRGKCYVSELSFIRHGDEASGYYSCHIGGGSYSNMLTMNFTVNMVTPPQAWLRQDQTRMEKTRRDKKGMHEAVMLRFSNDQQRCLGSNVTLKCTSRLPTSLYISRRIYNGNSRNYSVQVLSASPQSTIFLQGPSSKRSRIILPGDGPISLKLTNLSLADAGVYQCHTKKAWAPSAFVVRRMHLEIVDCSPPISSDYHFPSLTLSIALPITFVLILLVLAALWVRLHFNKMEHRSVVVVQPSPNAVYSDSDGTLSTLGSSSALLAPLRPPEVRVQRRFGRRTGSMSTHWVRSRTNHILYELPEQAGWEVVRSRLSLGAEIGEGAFGVVRKGTLDGVDVAVKMLKVNFNEEELTDLVKEMEIMKLLEPHPNIIRLLGVCTHDGPIAIINEFAPHGNLRDFLRARRPGFLGRAALPRGLLTYRHLIDFAAEAANGLDYLTTRSVVHRDIAARNVLVGPAFEAKIADFGLSRHVVNYYRKTTEGRLPVKWLAPEALFDHVFTREGDVWSYGILLWEIFSLGGSPYPSVPVERLFVLLNQGFRNESPFYAFPHIYELMCRCWSQEPLERPHFAELRHELEQMRGVEEYAQLLRDIPSDSEHYLSMEV